MSVLLGLVPAGTVPLVAYLVRPAAGAVAPVRLALARAAVLVGGATAGLVEALSAAHALTPGVLAAAWGAGAAAAAVGAMLRYRRGTRPGWRAGARAAAARVARVWSGTGGVERLLLVAMAVQIAAELIIAVLSPPNNFDSQTYHLPKIEHWVAQRDVSFYPTAIDRQLAMAPGAEYLLLQLRLLSGGDGLYNLVQLAAGIGAALLASRVVSQLGGSVRAQLFTAFVVCTTPMVALESTSTQTDLVVAAWVAALATLVLDELSRRTPGYGAALIGLAAGLTVLTKATGVLGAGPLLLVWLAAQARRGVPRAARVALLAALLALAVAGPYLGRTTAQYGSPLGPPDQRDAISMQRHDPLAVLVNALRIGQTVLQVPSDSLNAASATAVRAVSRTLGVDPDDRSITFWGATFPVRAWPPNEDKASFPAEALLVLVGAGLLLIRPRPGATAGHNRLTGQYAAVFWLATALYLTTVKWQPWGNRLVLFLLVLGAPLAGVWLAGVFPGRPAGAPAPAAARPAARAVVSGFAAVALVISCCAGWLAVGYGWPRRLVGDGSVFTESRLPARFRSRPTWLDRYEWAAAAVRRSGAHRVGLVEGYDSWEYPWWLLLRGDTIVSLRSVQPGLPPPPPESVQAILCVTTTRLCGRYVPAGWTLRMRNGIGYALPPDRR
jgi:hypothetical protein